MGDSSSNLFYRSTKQRSKHNEIYLNKDEEDHWVSEKKGIQKQFTEHFLKLFRSSNQEPQERHCIHNFEIKWEGMQLNLTHVRILDSPFSNEEIKRATFSIASNKSPGPVTPGEVFHKLWEPISSDITAGVHSFLANQKILREWNNTFITLIPKVANPTSVSEFRPISLCNVVYKIISKCLTIRLRQILPEIIGPYQSAFVQGRLMGDAGLVAHELITHIKRRKNGKQPLATIKIDMNKGYDRIRWDFLQKVLQGMCFPEKMGSNDHGVCVYSKISSSD